METLDQSELQENKDVISQKALNNMSGMSPWMLLMGIMFIILTLFMFLGGAGILINADAYSSLGLKGAMQLMAVFYLVGGGVFGYGGSLLVGSGTKASTFAKYPSANVFEAFTSKQKQFWILMGVNAIVTIIVFIAFIVMAGKIAKLAGAGM